MTEQELDPAETTENENSDPTSLEDEQTPPQGEETKTNEELQAEIMVIKAEKAKLERIVGDDNWHALRRKADKVETLEQRLSETEALLQESKSASTTSEDEDLDGYDPEEIAKIEKIFRKKGFLTRDELEKQENEKKLVSLREMDKRCEDYIYGQYPDLNDYEKQMKFKEALSTYNLPTTATPENEQKIKKIMDKAYQDVFGKNNLREEIENETLAKMKNNQRLSIGSGGGAPPPKKVNNSYSEFKQKNPTTEVTKDDYDNFMADVENEIALRSKK